MTPTGYKILGWAVWQIVSRVVIKQSARNKGKLGAAGVVAVVLIGGILAARAGDDS